MKDSEAAPKDVHQRTRCRRMRIETPKNDSHENRGLRSNRGNKFLFNYEIRAFNEN